MASKKYTLVIGLLSLISSVGFSQTNDASYNWSDSAKVATKNMAQHSQFINNQYPYPANQRDMWNLGITAGLVTPVMDVPSNMFPGFVAGLTLRKSLGYAISLKAGLQYADWKGYAYKPGYNVGNLPPAVSAQYQAAGQSWLPNYRLQGVIPSIEAIINVKNILFHKGNPKSNFYATIGYSPFGYKTKHDALNGSNAPYNFNGVNYGQKRGDIVDDIENMLDGSWETDAYQRPRSSLVGRSNAGKMHWGHVGFIGGGWETLLSPRMTLNIDLKYYMSADDYMDGNALNYQGTLTTSKDAFLTTNVGLGFNLGNSTKRTIPKWFINPLNYVYNEVNRPDHMDIPDPVLPDADGDGVTDQFDMEPNTPAGAPVDSHGRAKDSDGDGVPDYKDKELLSSQNCFPVDADGVGKCPEPACCTELRDKVNEIIANGGGSGNGGDGCAIGALPSVTFASGSAKLSSAAKATLATAAAQIKANPSCNVKVIGSTGSGNPTKARQKLAYDRVSAVINYLRDNQGVSEDRFIFSYEGNDGDANVVDLEGTTEEGGGRPARPGSN